MDAMLFRRARVTVLLLLGVLLSALGYSWGYQSGLRSSATQASAAAADRQFDDLLRWYAAAARLAGYRPGAADGRACDPEGADAPVRYGAAESR